MVGIGMVTENTLLPASSHQSICKVIADTSIFFFIRLFVLFTCNGYCLTFFLTYFRVSSIGIVVKKVASEMRTLAALIQIYCGD